MNELTGAYCPTPTMGGIGAVGLSVQVQQTSPLLRSVVSMRERAAYLRQQANEFRRLAKAGHDEKLAAELLELAERCDKIAATIEQNLPIHQQN
ncbi:MAG: hypothetical protein KGO48_05485 [Alphaproteobacteria bacterium]|nr:hypothetical protein [Alphaproteobacteria bacterium]